MCPAIVQDLYLFFKPCAGGQVFLDKFSFMATFICSCASTGKKFDNFSLARILVPKAKLVMPVFTQRNFVRVYVRPPGKTCTRNTSVVLANKRRPCP
jgi:hypothetical protein